MKRHIPAVKNGKNILIGSGKERREGWKNLDLYATNADYKHDLNSYPYPFSTKSIDTIEAANILEHLADWKSCVIECARVLKPRGKFLIQVPHYGSVYMWTHYDHKSAFSMFSFDIFAKDSGNHFIEGDPNDVMLNGHRVFSHITRHIMFPKGWWLQGHIFEFIFNINTFTQLTWELWFSGVCKACGVLVILEK